MATDPATQFQSAGLQIPYQYTPVETRLNPPIQLPGTGELWAQVGRTAMNAAGQIGEMLQKSPLNPAVKAQMDYGVDQYKRAQDQIAAMRKLGPMGLMLGQTGPEGYSQAAPATITDPTMAARLMEAMKVGPSQGKGGGPPPKVNEPTGKDGSGTDQQKTPQAPPVTKEMGKPQTSAAPTTSNLSASTDNDFLLRRMMEEHQAAGLGETAPSDQLAAPPPTSAPSMFAGPAAAPPPAPSQPVPATQPTTPGTIPGSLSDQYAKQQLAQWQAQNAHPVMASGDALNWAKNFDTGAQRATYLPHGGPQGEPAYAFHMKGGGINTVPISQMVKSGGGPLVAGQNTSATLSTSDALMNQAPGQAQGMALGATGQAPPGMQLGQQPPGQAPAAPGQPYQPVDYRTAAEQGQPPGAYTAGPYQQAVAQAAAIPQNLIAQTAPAGQPAQPAPGQPLHPLADATLTAADQAAVQTQATRMPPPSGKYTGDSVVPDTTGPYTYYRNDDPNSPSRGRVYTILPGPAGGYFNQQRWYLGTNQYETYELPDSAMRQTMWDKWGTNGYLTKPEINKMTPQEMKPWLQRAWQNENFQRSSPIQGLNNTLDTSEQLHNYLQQISDIEQTLAKNGYAHLGDMDRMAAATKNAAVSLGAGSLSGMDGPTAAAIRALDQKVNQAQSLLKDHPELLLTPGEGGGQETPNVHVGNWVRLGLPNMPASDIIRDSAFSGQDIKTRSRMLNGLQQLADGRYKSLVDQAQTQWMRISDKHDANMIKMDQGRPFSDPGNLYNDHILTVEPDEYQEFWKEHPNTLFRATDGRRLRTPKEPPE